MKIINFKHLFRAGRRQVPVPASAEKKFKKKALLIGIQQVREKPVDDSTGAVAKLKRAKKKLKPKKGTTLKALKGPHRDVQDMKALLVDLYSYDPMDIVTLIDDDDPKHKQPTKDNIMEEMRKLVDGAAENDRFFFHFAGHSTQEPTDDIEEEDRKNEFIVTSDGEQIKDDTLKETLVDPLPPKASLIAVFDSCHSGTLLDLKHFRCNRVYVPWVNKGQRRTNSLWNANTRQKARISTRNPPHVVRRNARESPWERTSIDHVLASPQDSLNEQDPTKPDANAKLQSNGLVQAKTKSFKGSLNEQDTAKSDATAKPNCKPQGLVHSKTKTLSIITDAQGLSQSPSRSTFFDSDDRQFMSPVALYCTGHCRENFKHGHEEGEVLADVISISSSKDSQKSWEDKDGFSMTQALVRNLRKNPHPSLRDLMTHISHNIHDVYIDMHARAREYKKKVRAANEEMVRKGKEPKEGDEVEMNNFQDPQLSSDRPLDMSRPFWP